MFDWWSGLTALNQFLYVLAGVFSALFLWQVVAAVIGLAGGEDFELGGDVGAGDVADADAALDVDALEAHSAEDAVASVSAFKLLSVRAIMAFGMLFCWAAALYLDQGRSPGTAMLYGLGWGLAAYAAVTAVMHWLLRLAETGTKNIATCVGSGGTVYLDIPPGGVGEVRTRVSGVVSLVRARAAGGAALPSGTRVRVVRTLDGSTVEVEPVRQVQREQPA